MITDAARTRAQVNDWLKAFCLAIRNIAVHTEEHPRGVEYLERALDALRQVAGDRSHVVLTRTGGQLLLDHVILDRDEGLTCQLAEELSCRGIDNLVIRANLSPRDHLCLIKGLLTGPETIAALGGFHKYLSESGVATVLVNVNGPGPLIAPEAARGMTEQALVGFFTHAGRGLAGREFEVRQDGEGDPPTVTAALSSDPAGVSRAIITAAQGRDPSERRTSESLAEITADTLERMSLTAMDEHQWDRDDILRAVGRIMVASDPEFHSTLFLEKAGPRSIRKNLLAAVERLTTESVANLVACHHHRARGDFLQLTEILNRVAIWRHGRKECLAAIERVVRSQGLDQAEMDNLVDHLQWSELTLDRRLDLLRGNGGIWRADFSRIKEVLVKLLAAERHEDLTEFVRQYLTGLESADLSIRRRVADNSRYILQFIEKSARGLSMLARIADQFFARLSDEDNDEIASRLSAGLAFLADVRLRSGELGSALELMRRAEKLKAATSAISRSRGECLTEAFSRAGNDRIFQELCERLLAGADNTSMEAAEILKRGGTRSASYLIERLAEEENRTHRARLVMLLKDMGRASSKPFVARLGDPRWYLVRNVVGILGDIGDASILPDLRTVASHHDPRVRREVVRTYARLESPEREELIIAALGDEDTGVQITAVNALASLKSSRARGVLLDIAKKKGAFERTPVGTRQEAVLCLGKTGSSAAFPVLREIITRRRLLGFAEPAEVRVAAARALGGLSSKEARRLLKDLSEKDSRQAVREAAREALGQAAG